MSDKKAVFFCSATDDIDPKFKQAAHTIVRAACLRGYDIVSGGTKKGTMADVCDEAVRCGAKVIGVLPRFMKEYKYPALDECIWTDRMSERKDAMREGTTIAIALPGGIGTLDELCETFCLARLGLYKGKIIVFNLDGFYNSFKQHLNVCIEANMLGQKDLDIASFPETVEELEKLL